MLRAEAVERDGKLLVPLVVRRQARNEMPANCRTLKQRLETLPSRSAA